MRKPIWQQLVEAQQGWLGGDIEDLGDSMDRQLAEEGTFPIQGKIAGMEYRKNGENSMYFEVSAEEGWGCGGDTQFLGIAGGEKGWLTLSGYGGHTWRIKKPEQTKTNPQTPGGEGE